MAKDKLEDTPEFEMSFGLHKRWCRACKRRTPHELDKGHEENKWEPKAPGGWWCLDCGELSA